MPPGRSNRELIELELSSLIQKLAYLRGGGMTPRSFPTAEADAIAAFGLACCRRMQDEMHARDGSGTHTKVGPSYAFDEDGNYRTDPMDEDTEPGWKSRRGSH